MRHNGLGARTFEDARTWLEETGLCLFLPKKQFSSFVAPSFVEAVAGERNAAPQAKTISLAEELLVRLEAEGVAVRLNLLGQPGDQPDFVVAGWVLPYVYALRGDRDWRRNPQLTGSRQVSPLAIQAYKLLEHGDASIGQLKHQLGREVTESAVLRAITELWQQLRIIPIVSEVGKPAKWQLLRLRFQKAIAEGASTSQVTAISVLASIYLQAVIAATMEEVELFLAPLTARSKVREVLRGLLATRQVHTISLGHAPHFYVAGTLPEFTPAPTIYASATMPASSYFLRSYEHNEDRAPVTTHYHSPAPVKPAEPRVSEAPRPAAQEAPAIKPQLTSEPAHNHKPAPATTNGHSNHRDTRQPAPRHSAGARWSKGAAKNGHARHNGNHAAKSSGNGSRLHANNNGHAGRSSNSSQSVRKSKPSPARTPRTGHTVSAKSSAKSSARPSSRRPAASRKDVRSEKRIAHGSRKPALTASAKAGSRGRYGFSAPARQRSKKRG
jgi:23S rRNA pseudouridine2605 synthase